MSLSHGSGGAAAYRRSVTPKQMEAQVFARVARALREAASAVERVRAMADAYRLWSTVLDCVSDPSNQLSAPLRAQIAGLAMAVQRACGEDEPDLAFVAEVTEDLAGGLWG